MNYRHKLLQHTLKQQQAKWETEKGYLQQDIINLENSADIKILEQTQGKVKALEKDIRQKEKTILGLNNSYDKLDLKEQQAQQTNNLYQQKITDLETSLFNLGKIKLANQKEAQKLLTNLENNWKEDKERHEQDREQWASELAKSKGVISELEKESKRQREENKTLTNQYGKLEKEKKALDQTQGELSKELKNTRQQQDNYLQTIKAKEQIIKEERKEAKDANTRLVDIQRELKTAQQTKKELSQKLGEKEKQTKELQTNLNEDLKKKENKFKTLLLEKEQRIEEWREEVKKKEKELEKVKAESNKNQLAQMITLWENNFPSKKKVLDDLKNLISINHPKQPK